MKESCKNCKFQFDNECRKKSPIGYQWEDEEEKMFNDSYFPPIGLDEWCGEYVKYEIKVSLPEKRKVEVV